MEKTAILVIPTPEGQKYNYARKWKIPCVSPDWVFDSIEKGFCQSTTPFRIDQQQGGDSIETNLSGVLA